MQRCKAKSKRSGEQCKNFAIGGGAVSRMHGAGGGPKTSEGRMLCKQAPLQHGFYSKEAIDQRKTVNESLRDLWRLIE